MLSVWSAQQINSAGQGKQKPWDGIAGIPPIENNFQFPWHHFPTSSDHRLSCACTFQKNTFETVPLLEAGLPLSVLVSFDKIIDHVTLHNLLLCPFRSIMSSVIIYNNQLSPFFCSWHTSAFNFRHQDRAKDSFSSSDWARTNRHNFQSCSTRAPW